MSSTKCLLFANMFIIFVLSTGQPMESHQVNKLAPRIVGGIETTIEKFPWQVSLQGLGHHRCGGSIIGERWILTAAHCTFGQELNRLTVRVGSSLYYQDGKSLGLKQKYEHKSYNDTTVDHDIALLELSEPLTFTDKIQPIALPNSDTKIADGTITTLSGWGLTANFELAKTLRAVHVPILNQEECKKQFENDKTYTGEESVTERTICTSSEGGKYACTGDSGGPLVSSTIAGHAQLIGVVSWGDDRCLHQTIHLPIGYSRVTHFRSWIKAITGI